MINKQQELVTIKRELSDEIAYHEEAKYRLERIKLRIDDLIDLERE